MTGVVQGGWPFVWAAYGITAVFLLGYVLSIHLRYRAERARLERESKRTS